MIDIHTHILPALDDGPKNLNQSVRLVESAHHAGIKTIIATPHQMNGVYHPTPADIISSCSLLSKELAKQDIPVQVRPGAEVRLCHDTIDQYEQGRLMTLNNLGRHILLELPAMFIVDGVSRIIRQFAEKGLQTIIAHPERNATLIKEPKIIQRLHYEGAAMQVTAMSLTGGFGRGVKKTAEKMVDADLVALIASDIHPGRKFCMRDACKKVVARKGSRAADTLFHHNPEEIIYFSPGLMHDVK